MRSMLLSCGWLAMLGLTGCQNLGLGGYSAQSVTRVPPIGTGSYQVPGSYYGNAAPTNATTGIVPNTGVTAAGAPAFAGMPATTIQPAGQLTNSANLPSTNNSQLGANQVSTADYSTSSGIDFSVPQVTTASGTFTDSTNGDLSLPR